MNNRSLLIATILVISVLLSPLLFYGLKDFIRSKKRVHVKDQFYIEYLEMYDAIGLRNGNQGLVGGISEAYWDEKILVVKSNKNCYMIFLDETKYPEDLLPIPCNDLKERLRGSAIRSYRH